MRWSAVALALSLVACDSRVITTTTPSPSIDPPSASPTASIRVSPTPRPTAAKVQLQVVPAAPPVTRLLSYERAGDIPVTPDLRLLMTDDGRVITQDGGDFVQRRLTPAGTAAMLLHAVQTGLFEQEAVVERVLRPGATPPGMGFSVLIFVVANGAKQVRVSTFPSGSPDDTFYEPSPVRDKLTALARGYEDLSWVPAQHWMESRPTPYQPTAHRLFVLPQPNDPGANNPLIAAADADEVWPFTTPIDRLGEVVSPASPLPWRCAVVADVDARVLTAALMDSGAIARYGAVTRRASATLKWPPGRGTLRLEMSPLLPHERPSCDGASPPL